MFPYFGRKDRLARHFPEPAYPLIIEPFAGSMSWSFAHRPQGAMGFETDERVVGLWYRICADPAGFAAMPPPEVGTITDDLFIKLCSYSEHALTSGPMTVTSRMVRDWTHVTERAARWALWARAKVGYRHESYENAPDVEATWFIDPPYQHANRRGYRDKDLDYGALAEWVMTRRGQVIVCEQAGADWAPFQPLTDIVSHRGKRKAEVIWLPRAVELAPEVERCGECEADLADDEGEGYDGFCGDCADRLDAVGTWG